MDRQQIVIVWNKKTGNSDQRPRVAGELSALSQHGVDVEHQEPGSADEARELAAAATEGSIVVAAGGDGTVHAVAAGLCARHGSNSRAEEAVGPALGVLPLGTANDFARSLGLPDDPAEAVAALRAPVVRPLDVVRVAVDDQSQWMLNAASGGNAAEIVRRLDSDQKRRWGPWAYVPGVAGVAADLQVYNLQVQVDDEAPREYACFNIIVANARTSATIEVAPRACLTDGLLELILIKQGPLLQTAGLAAEFFAGDYLEHPQVQYCQASRIRVDSDRELGISIDGELHYGRSFDFAVQPRILPTVVGRQFEENKI